MHYLIVFKYGDQFDENLLKFYKWNMNAIDKSERIAFLLKGK